MWMGRIENTLDRNTWPVDRLNRLHGLGSVTPRVQIDAWRAHLAPSLLASQLTLSVQQWQEVQSPQVGVLEALAVRIRPARPRRL